MNETNNEEQVRLLNPREAVRQRVGMYLSSTENANICFREICDNALDEISAGYGDTTLLSNNFNGYCFVADNGRGLPISMSIDKPEITQAELSISELHSGSKFSGSENLSRVGMNGVGSSAVNFTSETYIILSKITENNCSRSIPAVYEAWEKAGPRIKKELYYILIMNTGLKTYEGAGRLCDLEKEIFKDTPGYTQIPEGMSTIVLFKPDPEIFENTKAEIPFKNLQYFLLIQERFYGKKVNVVVDGENLRSTFKPYQFEIAETIIPKDTSSNKQVGMYITFEVDPGLGNVVSEGSVNGLVSEGFHMNLVKNLFKTALKDYFKIKHDFLLNGLKFMCICLANECQFSSQTKENLKQITKVKPADFESIIKSFQKIFKKNEDYWLEHVKRLDYLADSMKSLSAIEKAQKMIDSSNGRDRYKMKGEMVKGFCDATSPDRWNCSLMLTEGLSAGGSIKMARKDTLYYAVLPLRGKVLNTSDKTADQALDNKEIFTIFKLMGLGIDAHNVTVGAKSPEEALERIKKSCNYGRIIISTDADPDGEQICNGIVYTIAKFARFLIDFGMVYVVESPLFSQGGKYFYPSDPNIPGTPFKVGMNPSKPSKRYKGLGSLDQNEAYDAFFNEHTRRLFQIVPEGIDYAMKLVEDLNTRKQLLYDRKILTNPFNFQDIKF